jgi:hypothetical protein
MYLNTALRNWHLELIMEMQLKIFSFQSKSFETPKQLQVWDSCMSLQQLPSFDTQHFAMVFCHIFRRNWLKMLYHRILSEVWSCLNKWVTISSTSALENPWRIIRQLMHFSWILYICKASLGRNSCLALAWQSIIPFLYFEEFVLCILCPSQFSVKWEKIPDWRWNSPWRCFPFVSKEDTK